MGHSERLLVAESKLLTELYSSLLDPFVVNSGSALELFAGHCDQHWYLL